MKLGPEKQNNVQKIDVEAVSRNCDVIVIFPIYDQSGAIQKPDSGRIVCKNYVFINRFFNKQDFSSKRTFFIIKQTK